MESVGRKCSDAGDGLGNLFKRDKAGSCRVEILKADSDATAKFELFQRLNTAEFAYPNQMFRNSMAVAI